MDDPSVTPNRRATNRHDLITSLESDGWEVMYAAEDAQVQTVRLVCPNRLLHMAIHQNTGSGATRARLGILPGGTGEPARWYASGSAPNLALWGTAARAAARAQDRPEPPNHPSAILERLGWTYREFRREGRLLESYTSPTTGRRLTYQPSARAAPAMWTVTWPGASIGIAITAAEPYALPAFVLALLDIPEHPPTST